MAGPGEDDFLAVFVDEGDEDGAGEHDVGGTAGVAGFVDPLVGIKFAPQVYLTALSVPSSLD